MQIKNFVTISLMIFILVVVAILGAAVFINSKNTTASVAQPLVNKPVSSNTSSTNVNIRKGDSGITAAQVATHNSTNNCWLIISKKVYNVTSYISIHPGGPGQIIPYCGKDATVAFDTKGGRGSHSSSAQNILSSYYVGNLQ